MKLASVIYVQKMHSWKIYWFWTAVMEVGRPSKSLENCEKSWKSQGILKKRMSGNPYVLKKIYGNYY